MDDVVKEGLVPGPVVEARKCAALLGNGGVVVADCRHSLADPQRGYLDYQEGHLPGAVHVHADRDLSGELDGKNGRHPLPDIRSFAAFLGEIGVRDRNLLVAYDGGECIFAARLWWMTSKIGLRCLVLNGGYRRWSSLGLPVETGSGRKRRSGAPAVAVEHDSFPGTVDADEVGSMMLTGNMRLLDARDRRRFAGLEEPIDPVAGHIPGAMNRPAAANFNADGQLKSAGKLRGEFGGRQEQSVHYCGSGIAACLNILAMERAGLQAGKLYPGSWSEWCADSARPVGKD